MKLLMQSTVLFNNLKMLTTTDCLYSELKKLMNVLNLSACMIFLLY